MAKKKMRQKAGDFILDSSVTMAWYFSDEANAYARAVRKSLGKARAVVPLLWPIEVANILLLGERRQRGTPAQASKWLRFLQMLPIRVDDETAARAWSDIIHVARSSDLSIYDACYLELAMRLGRPLASLDDKLKATAAEAGVAEFTP
jgi:predicted nucleic acid-binding protein